MSSESCDPPERDSIESTHVFSEGLETVFRDDGIAEGMLVGEPSLQSPLIHDQEPKGHGHNEQGADETRRGRDRHVKPTAPRTDEKAQHETDRDPSHL